ncbi:MAG: TolC family protein [Candidatus Hinthialibacter antarcticus]|nr:TolC family protein [Candidatus Hinthialibacter antarcticus]
MSASNGIRLLVMLALCVSSFTGVAQEVAKEIIQEPIEPLEIYEFFGAVDSIEDLTGTVRLLKEGSYRPAGAQQALTLEAAIVVANDNNPQMNISRTSLRSALWQRELTEAAYRGLFDLDASFNEQLRTFSAGTIRFDEDEGQVFETRSDTRNVEAARLAPRYRQQFKNGLSINVTPNLDFEHDSDGSFDSKSGNDEELSGGVNMNIRYPLFSAPREGIRRDLENADINTLQSDLGLYLQEKSIKQLVVNNYWRIKQLERELEIQNERLIQSLQIEFIFRTQYEFENASRVQVGEAQIDVLNNQANLISQEGSLRDSIELFNITLGLPLETELDLIDELAVEPISLSGDECIRLVTENNVELSNLSLSIRQQENNLRVAKLGQQPDFNINSQYFRNDEDSETMGIGLAFSWPFGDGGATRARVRITEENLERLRIQLWNLERQLIQETYDDLRTLDLQQQRIMILERNAIQAEANLDNALFTFKEFGRITFRDMQDSQIDLAQSRVSLVQAIVGYNISKSNLMQKIHEYEPSQEVAPLIDLLN